MQTLKIASEDSWNHFAQLSGPIGWSFVLLGAIDTLTYDEEKKAKYIVNGLNTLDEAQKAIQDNHYIAAFGLQQAAAYQIGAANRAGAMHLISSISGKVTAMFNQAEKKPDTLVAPKADKNRFFKPSETHESSSSSDPDVTTQKGVM